MRKKGEDRWDLSIKNEEVLHLDQDERSIVQYKQENERWLTVRSHLKYVIEVKMEGTRRRRKHKQIVDDVTVKKRYWYFKDEALDLTFWRTCFGRGYRSVAARQTTE